MNALYAISSVRLLHYSPVRCEVRTWGGPRMVPFQLVMVMSSPSSRPYEHASCVSSVLSCINRCSLSSLTCSEALLAFLELFEQAKVAGDFRTHVARSLCVVGRERRARLMIES